MNFVGAEREIHRQPQDEESSLEVTEFCTSHKITWKFILERALHFGELWEATVKSLKSHLRKVLGEARLSFEEFSTVLIQVEACLNSHPITPIPEASDTFEVLTCGHFLIGRPITALSDNSDHHVVEPLRRWQLCQKLVRHLWTRWSREYLSILSRFSKWHALARDYQVGDIVCLRQKPMAPTRWPLARIMKVYLGQDGGVRVVTVRTSKGVYN